MDFTIEELKEVVYGTSDWVLNDEWVEEKHSDADEVAYVFSKVVGQAPFYKFTVRVPLVQGNTEFKPSAVTEVKPVLADKFDWVDA